jgi:phosphatidylserine/phosphatidylglycerophosphate/cardiolipin synthase-like enzyme
MNKFFLLGLLVLGQGSVCLKATEVYFSPSADCENRIVKAIQDSQKEILIAVYSLNNRKIAEALRGAKKRGLTIQVLTDSTQAAQRSSLAIPLLQEGFNVKLHSKFKIEHNKFAVFDNGLVSTGSFNWTGPASRSNSENCIFVFEEDVIKKYKNRFNFLWGTNSAEASSHRVQKLLKRNRQLSGQ